MKVTKVHNSIASTWLDPNFLEVLSTHSISQSIEFIPYPKKSLMAVEVFHSAIHQQYEFNNNMIAISVIGIGGLKVEVTRHGNKKTLIDLVHDLRDKKGNPVFNSIEPQSLPPLRDVGCSLLRSQLWRKPRNLSTISLNSLLWKASWMHLQWKDIRSTASTKLSQSACPSMPKD